MVEHRIPKGASATAIYGSSALGDGKLDFPLGAKIVDIVNIVGSAAVDVANSSNRHFLL
jgi:hypothetical protein